MSGVISAGALVFCNIAGQPRLLVLRAYRNWDFPKGEVEAGELPLDAAIREVREETGLDRLHFPFGDDSMQTQPYAHGKIARYYMAWSESERVHLPINPALGRPEHHEFRWVTCDEARGVLPPRLQPILAWGCGKAAALQGGSRF